MKVLVTGGAGFIGSHVVDALVNDGHKVVVLDDLSGGFEENVNPDAVFVKGSITDEQQVNSLFREERFDYVYHLAAYAAEGLSHFIKNFNYNNNLIGSVNLINASINNNVRCFIFTSSIAVYGTNQLPMREDMIPLPEDSYGVAKLAVERELHVSKEMFGMDYIVFRPHNVYGERQNIGDKYRNVLGIFMNQILQNKPVIVFGDGEQTRAFTHVDDVAPVIARSVFVKEAYGRIFNIGADKPQSVNQLAEYIFKEFGLPVNKIHLPPRNEVTHAYSSHDLARDILGYKPVIDLQDGIHRMAEWVKKHGSKQSSDFYNIEIMKNLPPSWVPQGKGR